MGCNVAGSVQKNLKEGAVGGNFSAFKDKDERRCENFPGACRSLRDSGLLFEESSVRISSCRAEWCSFHWGFVESRKLISDECAGDRVCLGGTV